MSKSIFLSFLLVLVIMNFVSADSTNACNLNVSLINQNPYPAIPNSYVEVVFQASGVENIQCGGVKFELIPSYPFSLDENASLITLEDKTYVYGYKSDWVIPYKLRIDKDALDGSAEIEVHYSPGNWKADSYITKKFNIEIQDSRTNFDAVIQEVSGSDVSIAIANIGKYTANSVVVRIPEQESFRASGTDGQMVGNLESGDYTVVGFSISPKSGGAKNSSRTNTQTNSQGLSTTLNFDVYYTDNIGERRVINMKLPLSMLSTGNLSIQGTGNFAGRSAQTSSAWYSSWLNWAIILGILIVGFIIYKKYPKQTKDFLNKIKKTFNKKNSQSNLAHSSKSPDWVRNAKEKEKNK